MKNRLIYGNNIKSLKYLLEDYNFKGKIDLCYIDTNSNFTIIDDRASTISDSRNGNIAYLDKLTGSEFITFLKKRLMLIRELLSDKGSMYLHTDYKIGHYVKVMMDKVFGIENFRNDITRIKCNPKNFKKIGYGNIKDLILFYSKGSKPIWDELKEPSLEHYWIGIAQSTLVTEATMKKIENIPFHLTFFSGTLKC